MYKHKYYKMTERRMIRRGFAGNLKFKDNVEEASKFHQSTTYIPVDGIYNLDTITKDKSLIELVENSEITPKFNQKKYNFNSSDIPQWSSNEINYDKYYTMKYKTLVGILINAFGTINSSRYETIGKIHTAIPMLLLFSDNAVESLSAGSYLIDQREKCLLQIDRWESNYIIDKVAAFLKEKRLPSYMAIAYLIDMQKSTRIHGKRGYRHTLIEIGSMKQSFREVIRNNNENLAEHSWSDFPDNALSNVIGTNVKSAPLLLVQWFGKGKRGD